MTAPVSAIIPFYNGHAFIQRALDSIQQQTVRPAEIVVVDDGSAVPLTDNNVVCDVVPLRIIRHSQNRGIAAARNTAVDAATQPWLAFLDQDDEWLPHKTERQWRAVEGQGSTADRNVYYGRAVRRDSAGRELVWPLPDRMKQLDASSDVALEQLVAIGNLIPFITVLIAKRAWAAAGRFDERLRGGSDDYALLLRLAADGRTFRGDADDILARRYETGANHSDALRFLHDDVFLLEELAKDVRATRPHVRRGIAAAWYRAGRGLLDHDPTRAREYLRHAVRLRPFSPRTIAAVIAAHSPSPIRRVMTAAWERGRHTRYRAE
jgi:glycosyltransferase involved in cell wall biosynthesis